MGYDDDKNPWGQSEGPRNPWGNGHGRGPHQPPPDLDEMLRRAQENFRQIMPGGMGGGKAILIAVAAVVALWLASGFYMVQPAEDAVIQRFGALSRTQAEEGLGYHLPWPVESVSKINIDQTRELSIGFSAVGGRGGESKRDIPEESLMLTSDANIVNLDLVVQWNISSAEEFLFNIRDQENTIKKVAESAIREVVGQTPMFPIITRARQEVADRAREIMDKNLDEYKSGVRIRQVLIQEAEVHPDVQDAFQDVQSAKQDAFDVQNRAQAYREEILPKARGEGIQMKQGAEAYKQSEIAKATGDAERFNSVYQAYLGGKDVTRERMYIEAMEKVLTNAQKIIMDGKSSGTGVVPYLPLNETQRKQ